MGVRQLKPVTPGSRFASRPDFADITTDRPEKSLTKVGEWCEKSFDKALKIVTN
mgnify:CR=1 FL=1